MKAYSPEIIIIPILPETKEFEKNEKSDEQVLKDIENLGLFNSVHCCK
jgi:hypothetical protein